MTLSQAEQLQLRTVLAHYPELEALIRHLRRSFAVMLAERQGEGLLEWLDAVRRGVSVSSAVAAAPGIRRS
ncbi:hypothetical protein [Streptomyces cucumeris]|uniref:hypothetical protein n=1 Tax=Streptomyces cucumeris TaxID=2962890 RepID=UPI003D764D2D